jgi:biotin operon repressor
MKNNIKFINIPAPILKLDIPDKAKMILGLVAGFRAKGLFVSNTKLAELFGCCRKTIINNINCLRDKGYIVDAGPDDYHRKLVASGVTITLLDGGDGETSCTTDSESSFTISGKKGVTSCTHNKNNNKNNKQTGVGAAASGSMELFDRFYSAYPKQQKKPAALKEWEKLNPDADLRKKIMSGLSTQKASELWTKEDGRFISHPNNWLRDRRWEDQVPKSNNHVKLTEPTPIDEARNLYLELYK